MTGGRAVWPGIVMLVLFPNAVVAQCSDATSTGDVICVFRSPRWAGEFASLTANGLLGGLTAGVMQSMRGRPFSDGFVRGALGGAMTYAGKRVAAERFDGAGLLGREFAAAGASVVRNAGENVPLFDRLFLPVGPAWLEVRTGSDPGVRPRLDVAAAAWLVYAIAEPELELDPGASFSSGTFVFRTEGKLLRLGEDSHAAGLTNAGVIYLADIPAYGAAFLNRAMAHERIHVLQEDQLAILWTDPAVRWAGKKMGLPTSPNRLLFYNLSAEFLGLLGGLIPNHLDRPWELESTFHAR